MSDPFSLKAPCKDCPFRNTNTVLRPERIEEIMSYMNNDKTFPCHKTVIYDSSNEEYALMKKLINSLQDKNLDNISMNQELEKLYQENDLVDFVKNYNKNQKICAGWLILGEKEGILYNNFPLRYAALNGMFKIEDYKQKDEVYCSLESAINQAKGRSKNG